MYLKEIYCKSVEWIHLVPDSDHWQAPLNKLTNLQIPGRQEMCRHANISATRMTNP